jgi:hypothetical protein
MPRRIRELEWTPPIFGWQYWLNWQRNCNEVRVSSWDWADWDPHPRYYIWVNGSALGNVKMHWSVFFSIPHPNIRVHIMSQDHSLTKAISKVEKQVLVLERGIFQLRAHSKRVLLSTQWK